MSHISSLSPPLFISLEPLRHANPPAHIFRPASYFSILLFQIHVDAKHSLVDNIGCQAHGWIRGCPAHEYILGCRAQHEQDRRHTNPSTNSTIAQSWPWKGGVGCRAPHYNTLHHIATHRNTRRWSGAQRALGLSQGTASCCGVRAVAAGSPLSDPRQ